MDTTEIPLGERALRRVLDHVIAVGDEAETSYLEAKSDIDLATTEGAAKVAKFLLGAANRLPHDAQRHFQGYAVLVIGAQKGSAEGVPRGVEAHQLEDRIRPYVGTNFPAFEFSRIGVSADREVLFVIAPPPQRGQTIFPCHRDFQGAKPKHNLNDGAVYVRGRSNTRQAKGGEVLALVERARGARDAPVELTINVRGTVLPVIDVYETLETLYDHKEQSFLREEDSKPRRSSYYLPMSGIGYALSEAEREASLAAWRDHRAKYIEEGRKYLLGTALEGLGLDITSHKRFIAKPQLIITFHDCECFDFERRESADYDKIVEPIARESWLALDYGIDLRTRDYPVDWESRDNCVQVTLTPDSFRPDVPWRSESDDFVVTSLASDATSIRMSWVLTEEGSDQVSRGGQDVPVGPVQTAPALLNGLFVVES